MFQNAGKVKMMEEGLYDPLSYHGHLQPFLQDVLCLSGVYEELRASHIQHFTAFAVPELPRTVGSPDLRTSKQTVKEPSEKKNKKDKDETCWRR